MYPADDTPVRLRLLIREVRERCTAIRAELERSRRLREEAQGTGETPEPFSGASEPLPRCRPVPPRR